MLAALLVVVIGGTIMVALCVWMASPIILKHYKKAKEQINKTKIQKEQNNVEVKE